MSWPDRLTVNFTGYAPTSSASLTPLTSRRRMSAMEIPPRYRPSASTTMPSLNRLRPMDWIASRIGVVAVITGSSYNMSASPCLVLEVPVHVVLHRFLVPELRLPAQRRLRLGGRDEPALEVSAPVLDEGDVRLLVQERFEGTDDVEHADLLASVEVEDLVGRGRVQAGRVATGQVLDVDELPGLAAIAMDRDGLVVQKLANEDRRHRLPPGPLAERDAEPHDRVVHTVEPLVVLAEQLGGDLRRRVQVVGRL